MDSAGCVVRENDVRRAMLAVIVLAAAVAVGGAASAVSGNDRTSTSRSRSGTGQPYAYGWPVRPFLLQHPVRGSFGDPRFIRRDLRVLHVGIDIAAADGAPVYAVAAGTVYRHGSQALSIGVGSRHAFGYWHVVPVVAEGERVRLHQLVGHVAAPWSHVHFSEVIDRRHVNPLRPGGIGPYADATRPVVGEIRFEREGRILSGGLSGTVDIVVGAFDRPALPPPEPWDDVRLTPALVRWRVLGRGLRAPVTWRRAYDVRRHLPAVPFESVYAAGTHQNHADRAGWYRFYLARGWATSALTDGAYTLQVSAIDARGNEVVAARRFTVRNTWAASRALQRAGRPAPAPLEAAIADLGTLGGGRSEGVAMNELGQVVGWSETPQGKAHAFLWQNGTMYDLGTLGGPRSAAVSVNDRSEVVGWSDTAGGGRHAFLWKKGRMRDLGAPRGMRSEALAINEQGQVIGNVYLRRSAGRLVRPGAVMWWKGATTSLGPIHGRPSRAVALSERGAVIGDALPWRADRVTRAFLWRDGKATVLGGPAGRDGSVAVAINDAGQVVVRATEADGRTVLWTPERVTKVGTLGPRPLGARAVTERGEVIGSRIGTDHGARAFRWADGRTTILETPAGGASAAETANDRGQVVGWIDNRSKDRHRRSAVVWQNGRAAPLGSLGRGASIARTINNRGQVIGSSVTRSGQRHATIWTLRRPTVQAAFAAESYRPGATARLVSFDVARDVTIGLYRVGDARGRLRARDRMRGVQMASPRVVRRLGRGQTIELRLGRDWPTGLYFAQLTAPGGRVGYAPFVLAPGRLGTNRIAVVLPTQSWQAYNFRDDDGDGAPDTWYASPENGTARLYRPFLNRGVPPHFNGYDEPFLRWLERSRYGVDYLSDAELKAARGVDLANAYELLIFEGHHEYVTEHEYDAVTGFRDRGGNLMFLSGNNFFRKVEISSGLMRRVGQWRKLGRPEAALIGVQWYLRCASPGQLSLPWTVRAAPAGRWIFRGTGLRPGSRFASGGIEADRATARSPRNLQVLAEIENLFGDGRNAQMTYYEAPSGAKVFAAGAFTLAGSVWQPPVRRMMANLIDELSR